LTASRAAGSDHLDVELSKPIDRRKEIEVER
jgi:hypothetical protein